MINKENRVSVYCRFYNCDNSQVFKIMAPFLISFSFGLKTDHE